MSRGASKISGANNIPLGVRSEAGYLAAAASTLGGISLLNPSYHLGDDAPPPPVSESVYEWSQNIVLGSLDPWLNGKFEPQETLKRTLDNDDDYENNNKKPKLDIVLVQGLKRSAEEEVQVSGRGPHAGGPEETEQAGGEAAGEQAEFYSPGLGLTTCYITSSLISSHSDRQHI